MILGLSGLGGAERDGAEVTLPGDRRAHQALQRGAERDGVALCGQGLGLGAGELGA